MNLQSIPALVMGGITVYAGGAHLLLCLRHVRRRHHFLFALSCLLVGIYDVFSAALYNSTCVREGTVWQQAQIATLLLVGLSVVWFVHDYSFRRSKRTFYVFALYFLAAAVLCIVGPLSWVLKDEPAVKEILLPLAGRIVYYESVPGVLTRVSSVLGIVAFVYIFVIVFQGYRFHDRRRYRPLFVAMVIFCAGVLNDSAVSAGLYKFIYLIEYSYMGMVALMAVSLAGEVGTAVAAQQHLRNVEERFSAVFKNAAVGIGLADQRKHFISVNAAMCGMLGRSAEELLTLSIADCLHPDDIAAVMPPIDAILRGERDSFRKEWRYTQPGNRAYWGDMSFALVRSPDSRAEALIWIIVGITERRRAVDALRELNEELEQKVVERTTELESTNVKLSRSLELLEKDEEAGRMIQFNLLPEESRAIGDFHFARYLAPSLYMSGDFVDYFVIDEDHTGFYIADVSGHGVSSAFITVLLHGRVNSCLENYETEQDRTVLDPARMLERLNGELIRQGAGKHITMFYGVLSQSENTLTFANGGQFPVPMISDGRGVEQVTSPGSAVGLFETSAYENSRIDLPDEFAFAVFSDGVLEVLEPESLADKQMFLEALLDRPSLELDDLVNRIGLGKMKSLPDDITILLVKRKAAREPR